MKTIIAGSRDATYEQLMMALEQCPFTSEITAVICGCARGADHHGESWAKSKGLPVIHYHAEWKVYGDAAGPIRNRAMAQVAEALIAVRIGGPKSKGTSGMIWEAKKKGLRLFVLDFDEVQP